MALPYGVIYYNNFVKEEYLPGKLYIGTAHLWLMYIEYIESRKSFHASTSVKWFSSFKVDLGHAQLGFQWGREINLNEYCI